MNDGIASERESFLAIIPARGDSTRLTRKNLIPLGGRPLIEFSLQAALDCPYVHKTAVTSDDPEILDLARKWAVETLHRPKRLATGEARMEDVVLDALDQLEALGPLPTHLALLQPTSPLRTASHLTEAIAMYLKSSFGSLASITPAHPHPLKTFQIEGNELQPLGEFSQLSANAQQLPAFYTTNGAIYLIRTALFRQQRFFFAPPLGYYLMPRSASVDIDDRLDLDLCSLILSRENP